MKELTMESLQRLSQTILEKNKKINDKFNCSYYPMQTRYTLGTGCFKEGHFPQEIMTEEEIVEHFLRKSAVKYFLENTQHNILTLSECLEIPIEKLIVFDCLTEAEIMTLDMLRIIWEEEIRGQIFNAYIGKNVDKATLQTGHG